MTFYPIETGDLGIIVKVNENFNHLGTASRSLLTKEHSFSFGYGVTGILRRHGDFVEMIIYRSTSSLPRSLTDRFKSFGTPLEKYEEYASQVIPQGFRPNQERVCHFSYSETITRGLSQQVGVRIVERTHYSGVAFYGQIPRRSAFVIERNGRVKWLLKNLGLGTGFFPSAYNNDVRVEYCSFVWRTADPLPN